MTVSEATRRDIFDGLVLERVVWAGRLEENEFLERLYDLAAIPSDDSRFDNAAGDIWQHRVNNPADWEDDWIFNDDRFQLLNGPDEVFLHFLCEMVHPVVRPDEVEARRLVEMFNDSLAADGWQIVEEKRVAARPVFTPRRLALGDDLIVAAAQAVAMSVDTNYIARQVTRMAAAMKDDPELAIGTAKEFIETICKHILDKRHVAYENSDDLPQLVKKTNKELRLTPNDVPQEARAANTIRRLLSNLATVAQNAAELRNLYGTGHGKSVQVSGADDRHAQLAVHAAVTLGVFLFSTYQEGPSNP